MTPNELDNTFRELAQVLHQGHMQALGIAPTMQLAGLYNACKFSRQKAWRDELYATNFENLLTSCFVRERDFNFPIQTTRPE